MRGDVALFVTCLVDNLSPGTGVASVRLLEAAGVEVDFPEAQSCCGQPAVTAGEPGPAAHLARRFVEVFEPYEAVVTPSGSCAATVHHWYPALLDGSWRTRAERVAERTHELSGYLVDVLGHTDLGARLDAVVTVHDSCHGLRTLGLGSAVRKLLEASGAELRELDDPTVCCGFGGLFSVEHPEIATSLADAKLRLARATSADYLVAGDTGCLLHLDGRRRWAGTGPPAIHFADLLVQGLP